MMPGPGHYQLNIPDQIKFLTDKLAPRYKQNPFGSNISRFKHHHSPDNSQVQNDPPITEDEARIRELVRDLDEHVGVMKSLQPDIKTMNRMGHIIKKPTAKLRRNE